MYALREEGNITAAPLLLPLANFYPRPPRGGRLLERLSMVTYKIFLSTPSVRRATLYYTVDTVDWVFLSTPSARRATSCRRRMRCGQQDFYPRPPRGGRLILDDAGDAALVISIHALREEGDGTDPIFIDDALVFLSTPSVRRATSPSDIRPQPVGISIHALREEGDDKGMMPQLSAILFLSTPSVRRATLSLPSRLCASTDFYPRPP